MRRLTLRQLRIFEAVAEHGSISRAAEALHLTQPAVSMQLKGIEVILGLPLTEQLGKKLYLTAAGREVQQACQGIDTRLGVLQDKLQQLRGVEAGQLSIAVTSTAGHITTDLLARFRACLPRVAIHLHVANRAAVLARLAGNQVDLALMGQAPEGMDLHAACFMENPLGVIARPDHPLAGQAQIPLAALADEAFLLREPESGTRAAMERFFAEHGLTPRTSMEMNSNGAIRLAAGAGLGLGIVPLQTVEMELSLNRLTVLDVVGFPLLRHWYLVHHASKRLTPTAEAFRDFVLQGVTPPPAEA